jgi:hypothetical protein
MNDLPQIFRCEWEGGRVLFHRRTLKVGDRCPDGWHHSEDDARADVARRLNRMAAEMLRAADAVTRDRRGD